MREMTWQQRDTVDEVSFHFSVQDSGNVTLTWRFIGPYLNVPATSGYYCIEIDGKELTTWRHLLDVVEVAIWKKALPKEVLGRADKSYIITRVRDALCMMFQRDRQREICNFLGIANADPDANGIVPEWRGWIDLMKREEKPIPLFDSNGRWFGDLTEYEFAWTTDGMLWVMWNLTDSDGTRSMPHWMRHVIPTEWLQDGWEAFLDRHTEAFPGLTRLYPRRRLEERNDLRAFLGL